MCENPDDCRSLTPTPLLLANNMLRLGLGNRLMFKRLPVYVYDFIFVFYIYLPFFFCLQSCCSQKILIWPRIKTGTEFLTFTPQIGRAHV